MKLLLDENLSRRVIPFIIDAFSGSTQVTLVGLENADDMTIWQYALEKEFVIVTKDADFFDMATVFGQPPKIIWLKTGNQSKTGTIKALICNKEIIEKSLLDENKVCIEIYQ